MLLNPDTFEKLRIKQVSACPLCGCVESAPFEHHPNPVDRVHAVRCQGCQLVYMDGVVEEMDLVRLYEGFNDSRDTDSRELAAQRAAMYDVDVTFVRRFHNGKGMRIADIGCGSGDLLARFPDALERTGVEIDSVAVAEGKRFHPEMHFFHALNEIPEQARFDMVIFRGVIQYMPSLDQVAHFCAEHIVEKGKLIFLATPNADSLLAQVQREQWALFNRYDRYCFGLSQLRRLFERSFQLIGFDFPYLGTPYEKYLEDYKKVVNMFEDKDAVKQRVPFFGSMMSVAFEKKGEN